MNFKKKALGVAIALSMGTAGAVSTAHAGDLVLTFANNTQESNPDNTLLGFAANTEFHVVTPYGSGTNDGDKDVMSGGETWSFAGTSNSNLVSALMTAVGNTDTNSGGGGEAAVLTTGVTGFPIAGTAGAFATIQQGASFLQTNNFFTMAAPTTGSIFGTTFGAAHIDVFDTTNGIIEINMPVIHTQWATGSYIIGGDPNANPTNGDKCADNGPCGGPGVQFIGTLDGAGNFTLSASYSMTKDEVSVLGFNNNSVEWSLQGTYVITPHDGNGGPPVVIPVPAAAWLFGSGLMGLAGIARRRRSKKA